METSLCRWSLGVLLRHREDRLLAGHDLQQGRLALFRLADGARESGLQVLDALNAFPVSAKRTRQLGVLPPEILDSILLGGDRLPVGVPTHEAVVEHNGE